MVDKKKVTKKKPVVKSELKNVIKNPKPIKQGKRNDLKNKKKSKEVVKVKKKVGRPKKKSNRGRPKAVNEIVLLKLEYAFSIGCNDTQACIHAGISRQTLWNYQEKNPDFIDKKEELKETLPLQAKNNLAYLLAKGDPAMTRFILEKLDPKFSNKLNISGSVEHKEKIVYVLKEEHDAMEAHINEVIGKKNPNDLKVIEGKIKANTKKVKKKLVNKKTKC